MSIYALIVSTTGFTIVKFVFAKQTNPLAQKKLKIKNNFSKNNLVISLLNYLTSGFGRPSTNQKKKNDIT
jgi:hypothetical protein